MRKINFEQGSEEWLNWRRSLLTATDAAILLGKSPYVTPYQGWQRKLGLIPEQKSTPAMERGHRDEPVARELFIKEYGINMIPCCVESETHPFIGASLDGISSCGEYILEVKSQRPVDKIPEMHMLQIQHQLLNTDGIAKKAFYVSHWDGINKTFEVYPDSEWQKEYLPKAKEFWKRVILFDAPPLSNKDYKDMNQVSSWYHFANEYKKISTQIKQLEELKEGYKKELIALCGDDSCLGAGIKALKKLVKGRVDYDSIPELSHVNLEKYRKKSNISWVIMVDQN